MSLDTRREQLHSFLNIGKKIILVLWETIFSSLFFSHSQDFSFLLCYFDLGVLQMQDREESVFHLNFPLLQHKVCVYKIFLQLKTFCMSVMFFNKWTIFEGLIFALLYACNKIFLIGFNLFFSPHLKAHLKMAFPLHPLL